MVDVFRPASEAPGDRRGRDRDRRAGGVDAARHPQRRGGGHGEAAGIEIIMNRCPKIEFGRLGGELSWSGVNSGIIQNRAPAGPAPAPPQGARRAPVAQPDLRVRDPRDPCRRRARPDHRRALDPDLPDDVLCVRRCRPRRLALQPAQFRLHLFAPDQPDRLGARRARRQPRRRPRRGRRRLGPCRAVPDLLHAAGAGRRVPRLAQSLWRLADPVRAVVQKARLDNAISSTRPTRRISARR